MNKQQKQRASHRVWNKTERGSSGFSGRLSRALNVEEVNNLRRKLREVGVEYRVVKNTLLRIAIQETGMKGLDPYLEGPTAIAIVNGEPVAPAKVLADFAKDNKKFELKIGCVDGQIFFGQRYPEAVKSAKSRSSAHSTARNSQRSRQQYGRSIGRCTFASLVQALAAIQEKKGN